MSIFYSSLDGHLNLNNMFMTHEWGRGLYSVLMGKTTNATYITEDDGF